MDRLKSNLDYSDNNTCEICDGVNAPSSSSKEDNSASNIFSDVLFKDNRDTAAETCPCRVSVIENQWDNDNKSPTVLILEDKQDVLFYKQLRSIGTAVVRCTKRMVNNQYYFEVKMTGPVYGKDVMIGVGTSDANFDKVLNTHVSFLGMDDTTWGYSYRGLFHHNGQCEQYADGFSQGDIIGVHLDLWRGTLTFYKNRKKLGTACSGLRDKKLYPFAASTASLSQMRLVYSDSFPSSLQFMCCSKIRELIPDELNVLDNINIPPGMKHFLSSKLSWLLGKREVVKSNRHCCRNVHPLNEYTINMEDAGTLAVIDSYVPYLMFDMSRHLNLRVRNSMDFFNDPNLGPMRPHTTEDFDEHTMINKRRHLSYDKSAKEKGYRSA